MSRKPVDNRAAILRRTGKGLVAAALMAGIALTAPPMANADKKQDIADCREGDSGPGSFAGCCKKLGGLVVPDKNGFPAWCQSPDGERIRFFVRSDPAPPSTKPGADSPPVADQGVGPQAPKPQAPPPVSVAPRG